jgi:hypothetical protein
MSNTTKHIALEGGTGGAGGGGVKSIQKATATAAQTVFTLTPTITPVNEFVFYNGHILIKNSDYTITSDTLTLTLGKTVIAGDEIVVVDNAGAEGQGGGISSQQTILATTPGQTVFALTTDVNPEYAFVYQLGHLLEESEYTLTENQLTLNTGVEASGDAIRVIEFGAPATSGGGLASQQEYIATSGQTIFALSPTVDPAYSFVYRLGHLLNSTEYTLTSTQLTLASGADAGDPILILEFGADTGGGGTTIIQGGSGVIEHTQASHGYSVLDVLKKIEGLATSEKAQADSVDNVEPLFGIVSEVTDANTVQVCTGGSVSITSHGLPLGANLYLSQVSLGKITTTAPTTGIYKAIGYVDTVDRIVVRVGDTVDLDGDYVDGVFETYTFTGDGSSVNFDFPTDIANKDSVLIEVNGHIQTDFIVIGDGNGNPRRIQFSEAIPDGWEGVIKYLGLLKAVNPITPVSSTDYNSGTPVPLSLISTTDADFLQDVSAFEFSHGLGQTPKDINVVLRCLDAEHGYSTGDELSVNAFFCITSNEPFISVTANTSLIEVLFYRSPGAEIEIVSKDYVGGNNIVVRIDLSKWGVVVYANAEMGGTNGVISAVNTPATEFESAVETVGSDATTFRANSNFIFAHGLSQKPKEVRPVIVCLSPDQGYSIGDELPLEAMGSASSPGQVSYYVDSTNIAIQVDEVGTPTFSIPLKGTGDYAGMTLDSWGFKVYANSELGGYKGDQGPAGTGKIAQVKEHIRTDHQNFPSAPGNVIPADDSIPQSNEGVQIFSIDFTPKNPDSKLIFEICGVFWANLSDSPYILSLLEDNKTDAIAAAGTFDGVGSVKFTLPANGTHTRTYKVNLGVDTQAEMTINGASTNRWFGGVSQSQFSITEILP